MLFRSILYFAADDGVHGEELWKSDGTAEGSGLVKDLAIYPSSSNLLLQASVSCTLYFTANDGVQGQELWKSDGTEEGTLLVKNIYPGGGAPYSRYPDPYQGGPRDMTGVRGTLYFTAPDRVNGWGLWKSDGTEEGTVFLKQLSTKIGRAHV